MHGETCELTAGHSFVPPGKRRFFPEVPGSGSPCHLRLLCLSPGLLLQSQDPCPAQERQLTSMSKPVVSGRPAAFSKITAAQKASGMSYIWNSCCWKQFWPNVTPICLGGSESQKMRWSSRRGLAAPKLRAGGWDQVSWPSLGLEGLTPCSLDHALWCQTAPVGERFPVSNPAFFLNLLPRGRSFRSLGPVPSQL